MKYSRKREAIYTAIASTNTHPSAEWVYLKLKPEIPDLSLGTVYRNIALFRENGDISYIATVNGQDRYDANNEPHIHFICTECNAVIDVETGGRLRVEGEVPGLKGAKADRVQITYYGQCPVCSHGADAPKN